MGNPAILARGQKNGGLRSCGDLITTSVRCSKRPQDTHQVSVQSIERSPYVLNCCRSCIHRTRDDRSDHITVTLQTMVRGVLRRSTAHVPFLPAIGQHTVRFRCRLSNAAHTTFPLPFKTPIVPNVWGATLDWTDSYGQHTRSWLERRDRGSEVDWIVVDRRMTRVWRGRHY